MRIRVMAAVSLLAFAAACSGSEKGAAPGPSPSATGAGGAGSCPVGALETAKQPIEIRFWHSFNAANEEAIKKLTDRYNTAQTKVKVALFNQVSYDQTLQKYIAALRGNSELPHIVTLEETAMRTMLDSKSTVPVGACLAAEKYNVADFAPALLGQYSQGGQLHTMPFQVSNPVLYYNKKAFKAAGLDPDKPPTTLTEVVEYSRKIVSMGAAKKGFAAEVQAWYPEQMMSKAGDAIVNNDNGRAARASEAKLDARSFTDVLDWMALMTKEGLILSVGKNSQGTAHFLALGQGSVAMTLGTSAALGSVYQQLPIFPNVELGVGPLPGATAGGVTVGGGSLYMIAKDSTDEQKAAVWDYMKFLNTVENQVAWHIGTGYIPTRLSASKDATIAKNWAERPGFKVAYDQLASAKSPAGGGGPLIGDYVGFRAAIEAAVESVLNGGAVAAAQTKAQADATAAIKEYNKRVGA